MKTSTHDISFLFLSSFSGAVALNFECINVISQYHSEKYFVRWPIAVGSTPPALFSMSSARILLTNPGKLFFFSESEFLQVTVIEKKISYQNHFLLNDLTPQRPKLSTL